MSLGSTVRRAAATAVRRSGTGRDATLRVVSSSAVDPATGKATPTKIDHAMHGVMDEIRAFEVNGTTIRAGDLRFIVPAGLITPEATPDVGHQVLIGGRTYRVELCLPVEASGISVAFSLVLRSI